MVWDLWPICYTCVICVCPCLLLVLVCIYWMAQKTWYEQVIGGGVLFYRIFSQRFSREEVTLFPRISLNTMTRCYKSIAVLFASGLYQIFVILGHFQPVDCFQQAITTAYTHIILDHSPGRIQRIKTMHLPYVLKTDYRETQGMVRSVTSLS